MSRECLHAFCEARQLPVAKKCADSGIRAGLKDLGGRLLYKPDARPGPAGIASCDGLLFYDEDKIYFAAIELKSQERERVLDQLREGLEHGLAAVLHCCKGRQAKGVPIAVTRDWSRKIVGSLPAIRLAVGTEVYIFRIHQIRPGDEVKPVLLAPDIGTTFAIPA